MKPSYLLSQFIKISAMLILFLPSLVHAEMVVLKSGQKLEGKVVEQTNKYIKMDTGVGTVMTYYADEVDTVDGKSFESPKPVISHPVESLPQPVVTPTAPTPEIVPTVAPLIVKDQVANVVTPPIEPNVQATKEVPQTATVNTTKDDEYDYAGFWETDCSENAGIFLERDEKGYYSISFCTPDGKCFGSGPVKVHSPEKEMHIQTIDKDTFKMKGSRDEITVYHRCAKEPKTIIRRSFNKGTATELMMSAFFSRGILPILFAIVFYLAYVSGLFCLARKHNVTNAWLVWIPFMDFYGKCRIGDKPWWWFILFYGYSFWLTASKDSIGMNFVLFILILPIFIMDIKVWIGVLRSCNKSLWWLLVAYPLAPLGGQVGLVWYLATRKED
ncbi:MAG: hypothetical protein HQL15_00405 [Candidatus Omnitrophica bacterium]|nr:hypothetical protein [Candidatus Omnitrophota bacterium]